MRGRNVAVGSLGKLKWGGGDSDLILDKNGSDIEGREDRNLPREKRGWVPQEVQGQHERQVPDCSD